MRSHSICLVINRLIVIILVFLRTTALAQDAAPRGMPTEMDTSKVTEMNNRAFKLVFSDPEAAKKTIQNAERLAKSRSFDQGLAHCYQVWGTLLDTQGKYDSAISIYKKGLDIILTASLENSDRHLALNNGLGVAYYHQGKYPQALEVLLETLTRSENVQPGGIRAANILMNIGLIYHDQHEFDQALQYYMSSLKAAERMNNKILLARASNNIGLIYKETFRYDEAIQFFTVSVANKKMTGDSLGVSATYANLGDVFMRTRQLTTALHFLDRAEAIKIKFSDKMGLVQVYDTRVMILLDQQRYQEALVVAAKALECASAIGGESKVTAYHLMFKVHEALGDYKKALAWHQRKTGFSDSLFNETKSRQLAELQTLYDMHQKEKEILTLENKNDEAAFQRNVLVICLLSAILIAALIVGFVRYRQKKSREIYAIERDLHLKEMENLLLREEELRKELEFKNKELAAYTINFLQKSELMEELKRNLQAMQTSDIEMSRKISSIQKLIENTYQVDRDWEDFKVQFENVHRNFFKSLKEICPELTTSDLKLCALLKLNMNLKEAAKVLGISPESVKTSRYRLRKKLGLAQEENLIDFIIRIEAQSTVEQPLAISA